VKCPEKITFGEMGVRDVLIYCSDYTRSHSTAIGADQWADEVRLSDIEQQFVCKACGNRGADVRPGFSPTQKARASQLATLPSYSGFPLVALLFPKGSDG
jgi:hypothetical protein